MCEGIEALCLGSHQSPHWKLVKIETQRLEAQQSQELFSRNQNKVASTVQSILIMGHILCDNQCPCRRLTFSSVLFITHSNNVDEDPIPPPTHQNAYPISETLPVTQTIVLSPPIPLPILPQSSPIHPLAPRSLRKLYYNPLPSPMAGSRWEMVQEFQTPPWNKV
jgi:hypothetical protein